jgi:hypothetical protein
MAVFETVDLNPLINVALTIGVPAFGAIIWRRAGASWLEIASWTIPVFALVGTAFLIASPPWTWVLGFAGAALYVAMMLSDRARIWWLRTVLRGRR